LRALATLASCSRFFCSFAAAAPSPPLQPCTEREDIGSLIQQGEIVGEKFQLSCFLQKHPKTVMGKMMTNFGTLEDVQT
jgi:hypothetical protein